MGNFLTWLRKRKYLLTILLTVAYLVFAWITIFSRMVSMEKSDWLYFIISYLLWIQFIFFREQPDEDTVEELYLLPDQLSVAVNRIRKQDFQLKKQTTDIILFARRIHSFTRVRVRFQLQKEGYWIIKGRKKYLFTLYDLRMQLISMP